MPKHELFKHKIVSVGYSHSLISDPFDVIHPDVEKRARFLVTLFFDDNVEIVIKEYMT